MFLYVKFIYEIILEKKSWFPKNIKQHNGFQQIIFLE